MADYFNTDNNRSRKYKINHLNKYYNIFFLRRANLLATTGHPVIIIRAFSLATTSNAELLNRAHTNILFLLLFIIRRQNIEAQRSFIYYHFDQSRPSISDTISWRKKTKKKTGLDLDTRNHYQRVWGRDQHGESSPCIDEPKSSPFQIS